MQQQLAPLAFWAIACVGYALLVLLTTARCRAASKPTPAPKDDGWPQ